MRGCQIKHKIFYWLDFCKRTVWGILSKYRYSGNFIGLLPNAKLHLFCKHICYTINPTVLCFVDHIFMNYFCVVSSGCIPSQSGFWSSLSHSVWLSEQKACFPQVRRLQETRKNVQRFSHGLATLPSVGPHAARFWLWFWLWLWLFVESVLSQLEYGTRRSKLYFYF